MKILKINLKSNQTQVITGDKYLQFFLFPLRIPTTFQVGSTKTLKQYKSNHVSENENQTVVFSIVIWM